MNRRRFLWASAAAAAAGLRAQDSPSASVRAIQAGDVQPGRAIVWARADRPSRMVVTWRTSERGERRVVRGPHCIGATDFTGRVEIAGLPAGQDILYTVQFEDLASPNRVIEPLAGRFKTAPGARGDVRFLWSGDTVGQGWGINPEWGGMRIYEAMRRTQPHFFLHSGDNIYADGPVQAEARLPDGSVWRNIVTPEKSKVAETLDEFRGNYRYNLMDENVRRFNSEVAQIWQWDDHEVMNNWSPGKDIASDSRYTEKHVPLLVARATRAFLDYAPMRYSGTETERVYRRIPYGPMLDVFVLDMRSYRAANNWNRQEAQSPETAYLGDQQREWLKRELKASRAMWKVIASDMPLGLVVDDGKDAQGRAQFENSANGDGPPLGRELEIADLLGYCKRNRIRNMVWLTADVHYTAAHYYDPAKARFTEFDPFWEFVSGPLNAGTFGPGVLDDTFGIQVAYQKHPPKGQANLAPSAGMQFFGDVTIDGARGAMRVTLRDLTGAELFSKTIARVV